MTKVSFAIRILFLQTCLVGFTAAGVAQQHHHAGGEGVPSEALSKLGAVHFPVSCSASVQGPFERGVAMLHSFWYEEARKQFGSVALTMGGQAALGAETVGMSHVQASALPR